MHAAIRRAAGLAAGLVLACSGTASAAPPTNDNYFDPPNPAFHLDAAAGEFDSATTGEATTYSVEPMSVGDPTDSRCTSLGTLSQGDPNGGAGMSKTVWWSFTGTGKPAVVSSFFSDYDTVIAVWTLESDGFHFVKCNDDVAADDVTSELVMPTTANQVYYLQVGGCNACNTDDSGSLGAFVYPSPANDRRAGARTIGLNTTVPQDTLGAQPDPTSEGAQTCNSQPYGKTVWYRFTVPAAGTATIDASGFRNVAALYQGNSVTPLACGVSPASGATSFARHLNPGTYLLQVGGQGTGLGGWRGDLTTKVSFVPDPLPDRDGDNIPDASDACPDQNSAARDANRDGCLDPDPDPDGDGVPVGTDKCPTQNARARDKNADGCLDPLPTKRLSGDAKLRATPTANGIRVVSLRVVAPKGAKVTVRCGAGCRFAKRATVSSHDVLAFASRTLTVKKIAGRRFSAGQKIRIYVTRKNRIGKYIEYRVTRGNFKRVERCLNPGSMKPRKRCR